MDANFHDMMEAYRGKRQISQDKIDQLTIIVQQLVTTNEQNTLFRQMIRSEINTLKTNKVKSTRDKDANKVEIPKSWRLIRD
eukprot:9622995-Ditylum_brightwellii.AAC.1